MSKNNEVKSSKETPKEMKFFKKLTAIPYLLVFFALLMPFATVSCTGANLTPKKEESQDSTVRDVPHVEKMESVLMEPTLYKLMMGLNLEEEMSEVGAAELKRFEKSGFLSALKARTPSYPLLPPMNFLWVILIGIILSAAFAFYTPLGSITLGMLTWVSMWAALAQFGEVTGAVGVPIIKVEPGIGLYAATFMIFFGTAMNLASIIRPIVLELKARRATRNA